MSRKMTEKQRAARLKQCEADFENLLTELGIGFTKDERWNDQHEYKMWVPNVGKLEATLDISIVNDGGLWILSRWDDVERAVQVYGGNYSTAPLNHFSGKFNFFLDAPTKVKTGEPLPYDFREFAYQIRRAINFAPNKD